MQLKQQERKRWYVLSVPDKTSADLYDVYRQLKKRQQKKVGGASGTGIASPPASPSLRAFSPAPSEVPPVTEDKTDLGDV